MRLLGADGAEGDELAADDALPGEDRVGLPEADGVLVLLAVVDDRELPLVAAGLAGALHEDRPAKAVLDVDKF